MAKFAINKYRKADREVSAMGTMNIALPDPLRDFVEEQVAQGGYGTSSEYVRELIRRDKDRVQLRSMLVEGARSPVAGAANKAYFSALRQRVSSLRRRSGERG
jgi:antitoxin ParD1/3/4